MLSRDCDGCSQLRACGKRFRRIGKGGKVYCPDGTVHLVDEDAVGQDIEQIEQNLQFC